MARIIIATVASAVVFFIWGAVAWMVLELHSGTIKTIDNEQPVVQSLRSAIAEPGIYWFPAFLDEDENTTEAQAEANMEQWRALHSNGPVGLLNIHPDGLEPMSGMVFVRGFGINLLMGLLASVLVSAASSSLRWYFSRVLFVTAIGLVVGVSTHLTYWNYMHFPLDYSLMMLVDNVIGWAAAGVVIGLIIRPRKKD